MPGVGYHHSFEGQTPGWESMELARNRVEALGQVLGLYDFIEHLKDSETPMKELMENEGVVDAINTRIADSSSGKAGDELCQWLYESYQTGDMHLQAVVLRYIPAVCGVYFSRMCGDNDEPLAGFEAVLLALYTEESKARGGRPILIHLPSLSLPSLYHTPRPVARTAGGPQVNQYAEQLSTPLEPQTAVKSTKRASIVGVALDLFWRKISIMPAKAKLEFCHHARRWTVMGCSWSSQVDEIAKLALLKTDPVAPPLEGEHTPEVGYAFASGEEIAVGQSVFEQPPHHRTVEDGKAALLIDRSSSDAAFSSAPESVSFNSATSSVGQAEVDEPGVKLPLSLDLLRPIFKVIGHCLMSPLSNPEVQEAAAAAARALYVRASQDVVPEAILAARSLVRLDAAAAAEARAPAASAPMSSASTPTKPRKSDMFLMPS